MFLTEMQIRIHLTLNQLSYICVHGLHKPIRIDKGYCLKVALAWKGLNIWLCQTSCYYLLHRSSTGDSGQECCYDDRGNLIVGPPNGGTADLVSSDTDFFRHLVNDVIPQGLCCGGGSSSLCSLYYQYRPSDDCYRSLPLTQAGPTLQQYIMMYSYLNILCIYDICIHIACLNIRGSST